MTLETRLFDSLTYELRTRIARALISIWSPESKALRIYLSEQLENTDISGAKLLGEPVFEAMFPWTASDKKMVDLAGNLLNETLVEAMDQADDDPFPLERAPYEHQLKSWEILKAEPPRSLVVSSGTGSGKTESFMVPVIDDLIQESQQKGRLRGVRALFLYPLNALIANQRERMGGWLAPLNGRVRFCLYNGHTKKRLPLRDRARIPHRRSLELIWEDGLKMEIFLDQGFGFLRSRQDQPFALQASAQSQAAEIQSLNISLVNRESETFIAVQAPTAHKD